MKNTLLLLCFGLSSFTSLAQKYRIEGHLTGFPNGAKFFLMNLNTFRVIDSATIMNDRFSMTGSLSQPPTELQIGISSYPHTFPGLPMEVKRLYIPLFIGNETVQIEGDLKSMPFDVSIKGSKFQDMENELDSLLKPNNKKIFALGNDLQKIMQKQESNSYSAMLQNGLESDKFEKRNAQIKREYGLRHFNAYPGLKALPFNTIGTDTLQDMYDHLSPELKNWVYGQRLASYLRSKKYLKMGDFITDFEMMDKKGTVRHLFDFNGGYTLLYFYTSNCTLCDNDLNDLKNIYMHYEKKITLIAVSADSTKKRWLAEKDKSIRWQTYWADITNNTAITDRYGPYFSPAHVLIDPQGKIVYKWEGYSFASDANTEGPLERVIKNVIKDK